MDAVQEPQSREHSFVLHQNGTVEGSVAPAFHGPVEISVEDLEAHDGGAPKVPTNVEGITEISEPDADIVVESSPGGGVASASASNLSAAVAFGNDEDFALNTSDAEPPAPTIVDGAKQTSTTDGQAVHNSELRGQQKRAFGGLKKGFLDQHKKVAPKPVEPVALEETVSEYLPPTSQCSKVDSTYSCCLAGTQNAKEGFGSCMLCLEPLSSDPREVINLCGASPRCLCLLHRRCLFNPSFPMNDQFRRCMICKGPAPPSLVREAVRARERVRG